MLTTLFTINILLPLFIIRTYNTINFKFEILFVYIGLCIYTFWESILTGHKDEKSSYGHMSAKASQQDIDSELSKIHFLLKYM